MNDYVTFAVLCWIITILVCASGLMSFVISIDYQDYMGSSLETWLLVDRFYTWTLIIWSVLWQGVDWQHFNRSDVAATTTYKRATYEPVQDGAQSGIQGHA